MFSKKTITILLLLMVIAISVWYPTVAKASIVIKGLISYWTLDEPTIEEGIAEDIFGDNDGEIHGEPEIIEGVIAEALHFGGNDFIVVASNEGLKLTEFTIETWVKGDSAPEEGATSRWLLKGQNDGANFRFTWDGDADNIQTFAIGQIIGGWSLITKIKEELKGEEWYHIVGTWDSRSLIVYLNGKLSNRKNWRATPMVDDEPLIIGGSINSPFKGAIDEVKIYNRALTESEVLNNFKDRTQLAVTSDIYKLPTLWGKIKRK